VNEVKKFRVRIRQKISQSAEEILVSRELLYSIELVNVYFNLKLIFRQCHTH
jgi:hypothetical protein